eukprot:7133904-Lingulodinium_polyedra.AAC.1
MVARDSPNNRAAKAWGRLVLGEESPKSCLAKTRRVSFGRPSRPNATLHSNTCPCWSKGPFSQRCVPGP